MDKVYVLQNGSDARDRMNVLCKMLNRDCQLGHVYLVGDYEMDNGIMRTTILDEDTDSEVLTDKQWFAIVNDAKALHVIKEEIFHSPSYKLQLLRAK